MNHKDEYITVLGSGTAQPMPDRAGPCLLLEHEGCKTLMDIGPGALRQLRRIGISHWEVDQILITHFHPDHIGDLVHMLFATRHPRVLKDRKPLLLSGPPGLRRLVERLEEAWHPWLSLPAEILSVKELTPGRQDRRESGEKVVGAVWTGHTPTSLAYRLSLPSGRSIVYSGDTGPAPELIDLAKDCDLLILECSFPDGAEAPGHLTPLSAGKLAASAEARKLLLIHFYHEVLETDITGACRRVFKGELVLGRDLLRIKI
ncbi:MAG: MBL fold metallo-hydrolase [Desulfobacteraceae bacterium]